eukprot:NODE_3325_length_786_cov_76.937585_g2780_i0.p1 GENE.NODE_3325_length_786_cov_76.937585_g2780_i0~~NODE_3325_length_786_cov_76.937585_g2780_i0.p1  ORF type:complete len:175 (-),score=48.59 NODE_3325_length_786_cov_76.937585_g2780_i0:14-538(-)
MTQCKSIQTGFSEYCLTISFLLGLFWGGAYGPSTSMWLAQLNKLWNTDVLLGQGVKREVESVFDCRPVDFVLVSGTRQPQIVYTLGKEIAQAESDEWMYEMQKMESKSDYGALSAAFKMLTGAPPEALKELRRLRDMSEDTDEKLEHLITLAEECGSMPYVRNETAPWQRFECE